ncbi:hypothetical protein BDV24DRAFT_92565 [Aspergillus arachidicola]|uniref:UBC core domain-containing protein n=1 Tax=Aspergillus arachidicola TaxID=656916 RepID=A0A5N6YL63_9EURO|nr:hypothetical protein BDV24DRAFT_92565 [Aspergillus arachidicola]
MTTTPASQLLSDQFKQMQSNLDFGCNLTDDNIFEWEVMFFISDNDHDDNLYNGGTFQVHLSFPLEYPHKPPKMKFRDPMFHPNISPEGEVHISVLHLREDEKYGYESAAGCWSPTQTPESVLLSVKSMLYSPDDRSPVNIEAARRRREDPAGYSKMVRRLVRDALE